MMSFISCYKADFLKHKRTVFYPLHILFPLLYSFFAFVFICRYSVLNNEYIFLQICQMLSIVMPLFSAIICGIVADREASNNYQLILTKTTKKQTSILAQIAMMLTLCLVSIALFFTSFALFGMFYGIQVDLSYMLLYLTIIWISITPTYMIHLMLAYKYGIGVCSIFGFVGVIFSMLGDKNIFDEIWFFIPYCWPFRFVASIKYEKVDFRYFIPLILSVIISILLIFWFKKWEGRKNLD